MQTRSRGIEVELLDAGLEALNAHGIPATLQEAQAGKPRAVRMKFGRDVVDYPVLIERWLSAATLGHVAVRRPAPDEPVLLFANHVSPQLAERLRSLGINFVDASGNAYVQRKPVLIWVIGRKAVRAQRPPRAARAFQPGGLKTLFALFCVPDLVAQPTRTIAAYAGVANGTVGIVLQELRRDGFLVDLGQRRNKRELRNAKSLLEQWSQAYARTLRPRLSVGRYRTPDPDWWRGVRPREHGMVLGGEAAEALLTGRLVRPELVTAYVPEPRAPFIIRHHLTRALEGTVEICNKFWPFDYPSKHATLAPPILIYADLLATADARCLQAAQRVYEEYVAPLFKTD